MSFLISIKSGSDGNISMPDLEQSVSKIILETVFMYFCIKPCKLVLFVLNSTKLKQKYAILQIKLTSNLILNTDKYPWNSIV